MPTPDNLNSAYLGQPSAASNLNTPFLPETASEATIHYRSDTSTRGQIYSQGAVTFGGALNSASAISGGAITGTTVAATSAFSRSGNDGGIVTSLATDSSADSSSVGDGVVGLFESTLTNVTLIYRSGNTTYHWVSSNGSVG